MTMLPNALRHIIPLACVAGCLGKEFWEYQDYDYQGIGCYAAEYDRVNMEIKAGDAPNMGPATCQLLCAEYPFYAIHNSRWCYCGHDFTKIKNTGMDKCPELCQGSSRDYCGNENNMMVYQNTYFENDWIDSRYISCVTLTDGQNFAGRQMYTDLTVQKCRAQCQTTRYFALGHSQECICLKSWGAHFGDVTGTCNLLCNGNKYQTCGGDGFSVYGRQNGWPECKDNQISSKSNRQACHDACAAQQSCTMFGYGEYDKRCILMETQCKPPQGVGLISLQIMPTKLETSRTVTVYPNLDSYRCASAGVLTNFKPPLISLDECKALAVATPSARYLEWRTQLDMCILYSSCVLEENNGVNKIGGVGNVPQPTLPNQGTITVYLYDVNQKPIPNMPITLINSAGDAVFDSKTAADGSVTITIAPGTYNLVPKFPEGTGPAPPNDVTEVAVKPGKNDPLVTKFVLDSTVTVEVTLLDGNGIPLANIPVSIYDKDGQLAGQGTTDANGVLVTKLPPGQYVFKPVYPNDRQPANGNGEFEVTVPNGNFKPMEIKVPTVGPKPVDELQTITVTLVDADGNALANIPVQIYDKDGNFVDVATTDDNGVLSVELPPGEYSLRPAFPPGLEPTEGDGLYHIILGPDNKTDFVIDTKVPSVVINGGGGADGDTSASINITVVDQNGNPIPAMEVGIYQQDGKHIKTFLTDATGTFLLKYPAGTYVIVPDYSDYEQADIAKGTFVVELKPGANQPYTFKAPVSLVTDTVPIDHNTDSIDNWPGQIKGTIYGDDNENNMFDAGEGISGVEVMLLDDQNSISAKVKTDSNGAYEFKDLVPGVYTVVIKPSSQIPTAGSQPITKKLNVQSNSTSRFDLRLLGTKTPTSGKLIVLAFVDANSNQQQDAGEAPIVAAPVILTSVDGQEVARGVTDQTGTATIDDVPFAIYSIRLDLTSHPEFGTPYVEGRIDMKTSTLRIAFSIQT